MSKVNHVHVHDPDDQDGLNVTISLTGVSSEEAMAFVGAIEGGGVSFDFEGNDSGKATPSAAKSAGRRSRRSQKSTDAAEETDADDGKDTDEEKPTRTRRRRGKAAEAEAEEKPKSRRRRAKKDEGITDADLTAAASLAAEAGLLPSDITDILVEDFGIEGSIGDLPQKERQKFLDVLKEEIEAIEEGDED